MRALVVLSIFRRSREVRSSRRLLEYVCLWRLCLLLEHVQYFRLELLVIRNGFSKEGFHHFKAIDELDGVLGRQSLLQSSPVLPYKFLPAGPH